MRIRWGRWGVGAAALFVLLQAFPYGRRHTNPPLGNEPAWDSPETRALAVRACFDCHSNQTRWPWYSHVAPASWLLQRDVEQARRHLNFSDWNPRQHGADAAGEVRAGEMPPWFYLPLHSSARLTPAESETLVRGLVATFGDADDLTDAPLQ